MKELEVTVAVASMPLGALLLSSAVAVGSPSAVLYAVEPTATADATARCASALLVHRGYQDPGALAR